MNILVVCKLGKTPDHTEPFSAGEIRSRKWLTDS